ncbi:MAG: hypothetical protein AAGA63_01165 [Pseudomonadota bacterium]
MLVLVGCGTRVFYYQDGAERAALASDLAACEAEALEKAPVSYVEEDFDAFPLTSVKRPLFFVPYKRGLRDENLGKRARLERSCMAEKGYVRLELDRCEVSAPIDVQNQSRLPAAENVICYANDPSRQPFFVTN